MTLNTVHQDYKLYIVLVTLNTVHRDFKLYIVLVTLNTVHRDYKLYIVLVTLKIVHQDDEYSPRDFKLSVLHDIFKLNLMKDGGIVRQE